jgi:hypothetical protein
VDFRDAINTTNAELTPRPWDYTTPDGGITLTVIPAGLRADPGDAEVLIRISAIGQFFDAEAGIPSRDLPAMIEALTGSRPWSYDGADGAACELDPAARGGMWLTVAPDPEPADEQPQIHIPDAQRLPLASALRRAGDVALGWED